MADNCNQNAQGEAKDESELPLEVLQESHEVQEKLTFAVSLEVIADERNLRAAFEEVK